MNITDESKGIPERWRAKQGGEFAYLTINSYGKVRVNKSYDYRHTPEDSLWDSGDYFRLSEVQKVADIFTTILKNRI